MGSTTIGSRCCQWLDADGPAVCPRYPIAVSKDDRARKRDDGPLARGDANKPIARPAVARTSAHAPVSAYRLQ